MFIISITLGAPAYNKKYIALITEDTSTKISFSKIKSLDILESHSPIHCSVTLKSGISLKSTSNDLDNLVFF